MKVDLSILNPVRRRIDVELSAETVSGEFSRVCGSLSQRAKIRGFRPGRVPRSVLQGIYGDEVRSRVLSQLVERTLGEVFKEKGLEVVSRPEVEAGGLEEGRAFTFSAVVEVKPEIELKQYLGLEVERVKLSVKDEQVEEALRRLQEAHARLEPVEGREVVERGDFVLLDFIGSVDGKALPGGKGENYLVQVGGGDTLAEFEEGLIGLKKDSDHTMSVTYPKDYANRELAGKRVTFQVVVREIKRKVLQPLDDEFAKDHGDCQSMAELRQKITGQLEAELREIQRRDLKDQLLTRLIESHPVEAPPSMVDQQIRYLMRRRQARAGSGQGHEGPPPEEVRKEIEPQALRQVRGMLLVERIAAVEKIEVPDRELQQRIEEAVRSGRGQGPSLRELYEREEFREELRSQMVYEKVLDFLLERAKVKEVDMDGLKVDEGGKKR